jgi:hypothetical protein
VYTDVIVPEGNTETANEIEALLTLLFPALLPSLTEGFSELEMPTIQGFTLANPSVGSQSTSQGFLRLDGDLIVD